MNLYKLTQDEVSGWDTFDSAVVAAENEQEAKQISPAYSGDFDSVTWASSPKKVTATLIGKAVPNTKVGVICASFNAG